MRVSSLEQAASKRRTTLVCRSSVLGLVLLLAGGVAVRAQDPGLAIPVASDASDQKPGSFLIYNLVTSGPTAADSDTRISLTNSHLTDTAYVRLFFVDGTDGTVVSHDVCLPALGTTSLLASDVSLGMTGFVLAEAIDAAGFPRHQDTLSGQAEIVLPNGRINGSAFGLGEWRGTLGAVAFAKINETNVVSGDMTLAALFFDGLNLAGSYNRTARVVQVPDIPGGSGDASASPGLVLLAGPAAGFEGGTVCAWSTSVGAGDVCPSVVFVLNRIGGNMTSTAASLGSMTGALYNDTGSSAGFNQAAPGVRQLLVGLGASFPPSVPDLPSMIPEGHSGWMKIWNDSDIGVSGAVLYDRRVGNAGTSTRSNGGVNLRALTLSAAANLVVPVLAPSCVM